MAVSGARFRSAYSTCPVCIPQRLTLLTGQLASTHGVRGNIGIPYFPMEHSLPRELSRGGYQTALVGRGFHTLPSDYPAGFEYYVPGDPSSELKETKDHFFEFVRRHAPEGSGGYYGNGTSNNSFVGAPFHLPNELHHTQWTTEEALAFLGDHDTTRPFFLTVGYYAPHGPLNPPVEHFNRYYYREELEEPSIGEEDIPPVVNWNPVGSGYVKLEGELLRSCLAGYYGNITFADMQIGRILLTAASVPNTYVIFTSDHGEQLGDHYLYHKSQPYEGASRIPFLIAGPGISPLQIRDETVGWHDILPTVLDLAGLPIPLDVDGRSIAPLVKGADPIPWREYLHSENSHEGMVGRSYPRVPGQEVEGNLVFENGWHSLTDGNWKYVWWSTSGTEQLFDLVADRGERHNLAGDEEHRESVALWRARLADALRDRPEGFAPDGEHLVAGRPHPRLSAEAEELMRRRVEEGYDIRYVYTRSPGEVAKLA